MLTKLGRLREFQMVLRGSAYAFGANPGETLDVDFVLGGSINREGDNLRIAAHLIDPRTGGVLWSEQWDRRDNDLSVIQSEIVEQISNRLSGSAGLIQEAARAAARLRAPGVRTAYELYVLGTAKLARIDRADAEEAVDLLSRSAERDPGLRAHLGRTEPCPRSPGRFRCRTGKQQDGSGRRRRACDQSRAHRPQGARGSRHQLAVPG